ncbi:hypothetical protein LEP1GSC175_0829 [Leptospira santarosai str. HAI821]|uniref:Uncharacterized protein n=2 Tax=Leptospira santarosai TaxID=28183 RepID=M6URC4_9LEPT|nr:hypothetical protein LEP1GSC179_1992 [Leptospira santarosai str. MOR084]EKR93457.1 hypothetical protein LEP1GSC163_1835 [Leptospira santarosai str. CBC379]EMO31577.1 hypothetical protein LEP1GSC175_0829 [Leptospira santarosai str. HAI821]EMO47140.1 hypothetical protein LEP1GSC187_1192 [Leptospira santarosai str. ZUN179]
MSPYFLKESCGSSHNFKFYPDSYYEILEAILSEREVRRKKFPQCVILIQRRNAVVPTISRVKTVFQS